MVRGELLPEGDAILGAHGFQQLRLGKDLLLDQKIDHPDAVFPGQPSHLGENVGGDAEGLQAGVETGQPDTPVRQRQIDGRRGVRRFGRSRLMLLLAA